MGLTRAYALSRLEKKLLWAFFVLGVVDISLGVVVIYYGRGRSKSPTVCSLVMGLSMVI